MLRMASRRSACQNWRYSVGPRIFKIIEKNKLGSSQCIPRLAGEKLYQVSHIYGGEFVVDLRAKTCSCRRWNLSGIPCPHAISAIFQRCENPIAYVDACYKLETYMKTYKPVHASSTQMEQGSSSNTVRWRGISRGRGLGRGMRAGRGLGRMARGNREGGIGISRGRGNVGQATADPNSLQSVTGGNGQGVLPSSHIGLGRGLPSSKLSAIRGRGLERGMGAGRGLPSSRSTVGFCHLVHFLLMSLIAKFSTVIHLALLHCLGGKRKRTRRTSFGQHFP
ncbi:unnamed protein product [Prunus brigantina]